MKAKKCNGTSVFAACLLAYLVSGCGTLSSSGGRFEYKNPTLNIKIQRGELPTENRYCEGKKVVQVLSGSENKDFELRGLDGSDSIVEAFNRSTRGYCLDLKYAGTTEIAYVIREGAVSEVELFMPAGTWAYDFGGRQKIGDIQGISQTYVVLGIKPSLISEIQAEFKAAFPEADLTATSKLSVEQVNWIVAHKKSISGATSPTHSNSGYAYAAAAAMAGAKGDRLTSQKLNEAQTTKLMVDFFRNIDYRSSSTGYMNDWLISHPDLNVVLTYEMLAVEYNASVEQAQEPNAETLQLFYLDVPVANMTMGIRAGASKEAQLAMNEFVLYTQTPQIQERLAKQGRRMLFNLATTPASYFTKWGVQAKPAVKEPEALQQVLIETLLSVYAANVRTKSYAIWALDYSGSMEGDREQTLENVMTQLIGKTGEKYFVAPVAGDSVTLVPFGGEVRGGQAITFQGGTSDQVSQILQFNSLNSADGGTDGFAALRWATIKYNEEAQSNSDLGLPTIFLVTDGEFEGSFDDFMDWAYGQSQSNSQFKIPQVIQIAIQTSPNPEVNKLAEVTGGRSIVVNSDSGDALAEQFRYVLGYSARGYSF